MTVVHARAPVRADPAGGGTDCPPFSIEQGGLVLNFAVARYVHASVELGSAGFRIISRDLDEEVTVSSLSELSTDNKLGLGIAFMQELLPSAAGCTLTMASDIPPQSGLGGSAALGVAVCAAIHRALGHRLAPPEVAEQANRIERKRLGNPGGSQDSYGAALGGVKLITYHQGGEVTFRQLSVPRRTILELERDGLLIYAGGAHVSGSIHDDIRQAYGDPDSPTRQGMLGLRAEAASMAKALEAGDLAGYSASLSRCREHHYALHPSCDSERLQRFFRKLRPYILGGKTCGAGGGGFMLVQSRPEDRHRCTRAAEELGGKVWPLKFDWEGVQTWEATP